MLQGSELVLKTEVISDYCEIAVLILFDFSGLSYWKLEESELYRPLPDNFESAPFVLMQVNCY